MGFTLRGAGVAVVLVALAADASAEPTIKLAEVIAVAVRQSPELERARIDVATAQGQLLQAQGIEDTHATASASGQFVRPPAGSVGDSDTLSVVLGVTKPLSTGGTIAIQTRGQRTLGAGIQLDDSGNPRATSDALRTSATLGVSLTQPLLRGRGAAAFEAPIRQADQQRTAAALAEEARARDLVVQLAQAYWQVAFAWRQLEVRKASLELAEKQLTYTEGAIRAEKLSRSDALAVQAAIATRKQDIIAGEQDVYERSLALRQLGGLEIGPDALAVATEALPEAPEPLALDVAATIQQAFAHSAELASLAAARRAAEAGVELADSAARSKLDLSLFGGPNGSGRTTRNAVSNGFRNPGYEVSVALDFDHAISGHAERGGQAVARAALQAAKIAERDAQAKLAVRATRAVQRAKAAQATIALATEAIGLAEQNVTAEQKRFELGKSTNFEVLRRQDELEQARLRHASAVADSLAARADLDGLSGAILARYGIVMP